MSNAPRRYRADSVGVVTFRDVRRAVRSLLRSGAELLPEDGGASDSDAPIGGPEEAFWRELVNLVESYDGVVLGKAGNRRLELGDLRAVAAAEELQDELKRIAVSTRGAARDAEVICDVLEAHGYVVGEDQILRLLEPRNELPFESFADWVGVLGGPVKAATALIKTATPTGEKTLEAIRRLRSPDSDNDLSWAIEERLAGHRRPDDNSDAEAAVFVAKILRDHEILRVASRNRALKTDIISSTEERVFDEDLGVATQPRARVATPLAGNAGPWGHDWIVQDLADLQGPGGAALNSNADALHNDESTADPVSPARTPDGEVPAERHRGVA